MPEAVATRTPIRAVAMFPSPEKPSLGILSWERIAGAIAAQLTVTGVTLPEDGAFSLEQDLPSEYNRSRIGENPIHPGRPYE